MLYRPEIARVGCAECQAKLYDKDWRPVMRGGEHVARPPGAVTPCWSCPKQSPQHAHLHELLAKNWATYQLWLQAKACGGLPAGWVDDATLRRNLGIVEQVMRDFERYQQGHAGTLAQALLSTAGQTPGGRPSRRK